MNKWTIGINGKTIRDEEGCLIATLEPTDSAERDEANARLIAAAPEMLKALKVVRSLWTLGATPNEDALDLVNNAVSVATLS